MAIHQNKTTYRKVASHDVSKETDLVITVIEGLCGPCAYLTDPAQSRDTVPIPVEDALAGARQVLKGDLNPRNLVIVDEGDLWEDRWGKLVAHPQRRAV